MKRATLLCLSLSTCLLLISLTGCRLFPKEEVEDVSALVAPTEESVATYKVTLGPISEELNTSAEIKSSRVEELSFSIPGCIDDVMVESDDDIRKGQPIARLQTGDLNFEITRAETLLEQQKLLYEQRYNDNELKKHAPNYYEKHLAELNIKCAQIEVERLKRQLRNSVLVAPFSGRVTSLSVERGNTIQPYKELAVLTDTNSLEMTANVEKDKAKDIKKGTRVKIRMDEGEPQMATVTRMELKDDEYIAHLKPDNTRFPFKMDDSYNATILLKSVGKALVVPNSAIREDFNGNKYIRVLEGKTRREVYVKIGIRNDTHTQILEGAKAGMVVVGK